MANDDGQSQADDKTNVVSDSEADASVEKTRANLLVEFANVVGDFNQRVQTNFTAALSNFETITRSSSRQEAKADILKVLVSTAFDEGIRSAIKDLGEYAPAAGVVFAYAKAIKQEVDRAAAAADSFDLATWITSTRSAASDAYASSGSSQVLLGKVRDAYANLASDDDKQAFIDNVTFITAAIEQNDWAVPVTAAYERLLYEGWTNAHFTVIGRVDDDISGFVDVRFEDAATPKSAALIVPLSDKIADRLNTIEDAAGFSTIMALAVHKRVCKWADNPAGGSGWSCGWFDENNQLIDQPISDDVTNFLKSQDWRTAVTSFR